MYKYLVKNWNAKTNTPIIKLNIYILILSLLALSTYRLILDFNHKICFNVNKTNKASNHICKSIKLKDKRRITILLDYCISLLCLYR